MTTMQKKRFPLDVKISLVIFIMAALLFAESRDYADKAAMFPAIMLACIMALSAYTMGRSYLAYRRAPQPSEPTKSEAPKAPVDLKAVFTLGGMTALYAFIAPYAGFAISSILYLAAGTVFFGERNKLAVIGIPVAAMVFVYAFFISFLDVGIPFSRNFSKPTAITEVRAGRCPRGIGGSHGSF